MIPLFYILSYFFFVCSRNEKRASWFINSRCLLNDGDKYQVIFRWFCFLLLCKSVFCVCVVRVLLALVEFRQVNKWVLACLLARSYESPPIDFSTMLTMLVFVATVVVVTAVMVFVSVIGWGERFIVCCYWFSFGGWWLLHIIDIRFIHFSIIITDGRQTFGTKFTTKFT